MEQCCMDRSVSHADFPDGVGARWVPVPLRLGERAALRGSGVEGPAMRTDAEAVHTGCPRPEN